MNWKRLHFILSFVTMALCASVLYTNCAPVTEETSVSAQQAADVEFYFRQMSRLEIDVVYEPGAEPFTGTTPGGLNYWDLLKNNMEAIFQGRPRTYSIPKTLAEMRQLPAQNRTSWTAQQAVALAQQFRQGVNDGTTGRFFVAFVNGYAAEGAGTNSNILGFSVTGTTVILMFKDVIRSTGVHPNGAVPKFVEQSTLIHEMAHALGFVNNGLPLKSAHQDSAHGAHCSNPNCVMHYLNEGKSDMMSFVQQYITSGNTVMMDSQCLQDAQSY